MAPINNIMGRFIGVLHGILLLASFVMVAVYFAMTDHHYHIITTPTSPTSNSSSSSSTSGHGSSSSSSSSHTETDSRFLTTAKRQTNAEAIGGAFTRAYVLVPAQAGCMAWLNGGCLGEDTDYFRYHYVKESGDVTTTPTTTTTTDTHNSNNNNNNKKNNGIDPMIQLEEHVITCALKLGTQQVVDMKSRWFFRKSGLGLLIFFGGLLLFMRDRWQIPQNNLIWLEAWLVVSFMLIGSNHRNGVRLWWGGMIRDMYSGSGGDHQHDDTDNNTAEGGAIAATFFGIANAQLRNAKQGHQLFQMGEQQQDSADSLAFIDMVISPAITTPMIGVTVLALSGENDAVSLSLTYIGLCCVSVLWVIEHMLMQSGIAQAARMECSSSSNSSSSVVGEQGMPMRMHPLAWVTRVNVWLCITPFITRGSMRLYALERLPAEFQSPAEWGVATLIVCMVWFLLVVICFSLGATVAASTCCCCYAYGGDNSYNDNTNEADEEGGADVSRLIRQAAEVVHNAFYCTVMLMIIIGLTLEAV